MSRQRTERGTFLEDPRRTAAAMKGEKTYQGEDCLKGHGGLRYTSNHGCCECLKIRCREFYDRHKEKMKERNRVHVKGNSAANAVRSRNYYARKRSAEGCHTASDVERSLLKQKGKCYWCGGKIAGNSYHVDHIIPLSKGGSNGPGNICISCVACNLSKGGKMPHEWSGRLL